MEDIFIKKNNYIGNAYISSVLKYGNPKDTPNPQVSIIMPVYKRPDTFRKSLMSAINQDFTEKFEIVVVDNYDGEGESPNLTVVKETAANNILYYQNASNLGMLGNWNRGIELSRSAFVTYCHDDDILLPTCISRLMELQKITGNKCILSAMNTIDEDDKYLSRKPYPRRFKKILLEKDHYEYSLYDQFLGSRGFGVGCLFNRQAMLDLGGYNKEYYPSADYALQVSYTYYYGCVYNCVPTFNYRIAKNESMNVYEDFSERDIFFRECIMKKLFIPKFILNLISDSIYRVNRINFAVNWGRQSKNLYKQIKFRDKIIIKLASYWHNLKAYKLALK